MNRLVGKNGVSLIEIMVAVVVFSWLVVAIYNVISRANHARALASAKALAKEQAEIVLRQMQRDIGSSVTIFDTATKKYKMTFEILGNTCKMKIPPEGTGNTPIDVEYTYNAAAKTVTRKVTGGSAAGTRVLSNKVEDLKMSIANASGTILIELKTGALPDGSTAMQFHDQKEVVAIQSFIAANSDPRWKDPAYIKSNF